jgi:hypothetical protein
MRTLRVLSYHPHLGNPGETRAEIENAQAYVDAGLAEWVVTRTADVETTDKSGAHETTFTRERPARRRPANEVETRGS